MDKQVVEDLAELALIALHEHRLLIGDEVQVDITAVRHGLDDLHAGPCALHHVEGIENQFLRAPVQAGEIEQVFDQGYKLLDIAQADTQIIGLNFVDGPHFPVQDHVGVAHDRHQWRAEFMRNVGQQVRLQFVECLQLVVHLVKPFPRESHFLQRMLEILKQLRVPYRHGHVGRHLFGYLDLVLAEGRHVTGAQVQRTDNTLRRIERQAEAAPDFLGKLARERGRAAAQIVHAKYLLLPRHPQRGLGLPFRALFMNLAAVGLRPQVVGLQGIVVGTEQHDLGVVKGDELAHFHHDTLVDPPGLKAGIDGIRDLVDSRDALRTLPGFLLQHHVLGYIPKSTLQSDKGPALIEDAVGRQLHTDGPLIRTLHPNARALHKTVALQFLHHARVVHPLQEELANVYARDRRGIFAAQNMDTGGIDQRDIPFRVGLVDAVPH